jgi:hypothetical protein
MITKIKKVKKCTALCGDEICNKKLKLTDFKCRCDKRYCQLHRIPETHDCTFNFKDVQKDQFIKKCGLGGGKVVKITLI